MTIARIPPEPKAPVWTDHPSNRPRASHHHSPPPSGLLNAQMPATEQQLENDTLAQVEAWRLHQLLNAGWETTEPNSSPTAWTSTYTWPTNSCSTAAHKS
jgi:hypothetical protein